MKALIVFCILLWGTQMRAQSDKELSCAACIIEHQKYIFKNFKNQYNPNAPCDSQDIFYVKKRTDTSGNVSLKIHTEKNNPYYVDLFTQIYADMDIDCLRRRGSFDILITNEVEGCDRVSEVLDAFRNTHLISTNQVMNLETSRPISCGSELKSMKPLAEKVLEPVPKSYVPYNGLAPLLSKVKLKIILPKHNVKKVKQQH